MDVADGVVDPDGDAEEAIIGAAKVAPAPINAAKTGIKTAWKETLLARLLGELRMAGNLTTQIIRQPTTAQRYPSRYL